MGKSGCFGIRFWPTISPKCNWCYDVIDVVLFEFVQQIIKSFQIFILQKISFNITYLSVPDVHSKQVKTQSREMIHVIINSLFWVDSHLFSCTVGMSKRNRIIDTKTMDFLFGVLPTHHAVLVNNHIPFRIAILGKQTSK